MTNVNREKGWLLPGYLEHGGLKSHLVT